ncbi:MAG: sulfatase [Planctomycetota bacterium]
MRTLPATGGRILAATACLSTLLIWSCGSDDPVPTTGDGSGVYVRDLFDGGSIVSGTSLSAERVRSITRGTWELKSSNGTAQAPVRDKGGFPLGTIMIGSGVDGKGGRSIGVPAPGDIRPTDLSVRFLATEGEVLKLRPILVGADGAVPGTMVEHAPTGEPVTVDFDLPEVEGLSNVILEIGGDCVRPTFTEIVLKETIPASDRLLRSRQGSLNDPRQAVGLAEGGVLEAPLRVAEAGRITLSFLGANGERGRARIAVRSGEEVVAETTTRYGDAWRQAELAVPASAGVDAVLAVQVVDGPGVWIAEERFDAVDPSPPTVLLITSDTHRGDHLGAFGGSVDVATPTLDALADEGIVFTNCFAPTNVTNPSHMALMTGLPLRDTRVTNNATSLSSAANTLAEEFRRAGYRTFAATSVMHLKPSQSGLDQGFDRYDSPDQNRRDGKVAVETLLRWVPEADGAPLFVWLHVYDAHAPYRAPKKYVKRHYKGDPKSPDKSLDIRPDVLADWIERQGITDRAYVDALYAGGVDYVDELIGRLVAIERLQAGIVAFTADHGESLGNEGVWWDHSRLNFDSVHIPLLLRAPGLAPARTDAPVEQIDVGRTLLDLSGIESRFPGRDLRWALDPDAGVEPRFSLAAHGWSAAVEVDDWMLTLQIKPYPRAFSERDWQHGETELFHLATDPGATKNVLDEQFARAKKMRAALITWLLEAPEDGLGVDLELTDDAKASLEALGYGGGTTGKSEGRWWSPDVDAEWNQRFE